jgi:predicted dehydrogenase
LKRVLRMGMVGGGPGSFIGPVHRMAAELDGRIKLIAGSFSSDAAKSRAAGADYGIDAERVYASYQEMIEAESQRPDGIELVSIVTPNHLHLPIAKAALKAGLHVVSDKPATATLAEALELRNAVQASGRLYALTYTYTGYPMLREAKELVARGTIGAVRKIVVDYPQGWLSEPIERTGSKQAEWRTDVARAGLGGCIGDIGVHAFNLAEYVSGERVTEFVADLPSVVPGRTLDDDCNILLRFSKGQPGVLMASQISTGERNGLAIRVYGARGGLHWSHERPNELILERSDNKTEILHAGTAVIANRSRLPAGHPEGFIEAFANIYRDFAAAIDGATHLIGTVVPDIEEGVRSMRFVERAVESSRKRAGWTLLEEGAT